LSARFRDQFGRANSKSFCQLDDLFFVVSDKAVTEHNVDLETLGRKLGVVNLLRA